VNEDGDLLLSSSKLPQTKKPSTEIRRRPLVGTGLAN